MPRRLEDHTGARIADYRKLRHLTQDGLAQRAFVSRGMVAKVEAGLVPASPSFVAAVARALTVDVSVLYGQPYVSELRKDQIEQLISPLSEALDLYDIEPDPDITPRPLAELVASTERLIKQFRATAYADAGRMLPGLLGELTTALHAADGTDERRRSASALALTYWIAHQFAARLGFPDLASVALERMGWVAAQAAWPAGGPPAPAAPSSPPPRVPAGDMGEAVPAGTAPRVTHMEDNQVSGRVQCGSCQGKGCVPATRLSTVRPEMPTEYEEQQCSTCGGTGWVKQ